MYNTSYDAESSDACHLKGHLVFVHPASWYLRYFPVSQFIANNFANLDFQFAFAAGQSGYCTLNVHEKESSARQRQEAQTDNSERSAYKKSWFTAILTANINATEH